MDRTRLGCGLVLAVIVGLIGYRIYYGVQRMAGLDGLVAQASASATAERLSAPVKTSIGGGDGMPPAADIGKQVGDFLSGKSEQALSTAPSALQANLFKAPIAVVDLDARHIDAVQGRLPWGVRAHSVREARTLVFIRCFKDKVGDYGFLQGAYARDCNLVGFDMQAPGGPVILTTQTFEKQPPQSINTAEFWYAFHDVVAARPVYEMANFVKYELGLTASVLS